MNTGWNIFLTILIILAAAALISMVADNHRFVVRDYTIRSPKIRTGLTAVFITDLHDKVYGRDNEPLLAAIRKAAPDAILVGGDLIVSRHARENRPDWMNNADGFLRSARSIAPVYLADGNHEGYLLAYEEFHAQYEAWCRMTEEVGTVRLHNRSTELRKDGTPTGVIVSGLDLDRETYRKVLPYTLPEQAVEEKLGPVREPEKFHLLLAHNPKYFYTYADWGADLVLSGHVHGGLLRLGRLGFIGPDLHLFPRYSGGLYTVSRQGRNGPHSGPGGRSEDRDRDFSSMIVSCGLGSHTLPIRIFNPGELTVVHLCHSACGKGI